MRDLTTEELGHVYGAGGSSYDKKPKNNEHKNNKNSSNKKNNSDDKNNSDNKYHS